jgi:hypothetical protein
MNSEVHICRPIMNIKPKIEKMKCPDCKDEQDFVVWHYEWYGWNGICLFCGCQFQDQEYRPLSNNLSIGSMRWKNIQKAKKMIGLNYEGDCKAVPS